MMLLSLESSVFSLQSSVLRLRTGRFGTRVRERKGGRWVFSLQIANEALGVDTLGAVGWWERKGLIDGKDRLFRFFATIYE